MTSNSKFSNIQLKIDCNKKFRTESERISYEFSQRKRKKAHRLSLSYTALISIVYYIHMKKKWRKTDMVSIIQKLLTTIHSCKQVNNKVMWKRRENLFFFLVSSQEKGGMKKISFGCNHHLYRQIRLKWIKEM